MAYTLCPWFAQQLVDDNDDPLAFGKVNTYLSGTTTPVFTFSDSTGTLNTNPVVLSASGRARIYLDPVLSYKFIVTDANDVPVGLTMDPVSINTAALIAGTITATGVIKGPDGSPTAPTYSFTSDPDIGMYRFAANVLAFAVNGVQALNITQNGSNGFLAQLPSGNFGAGAVTGPQLVVGSNTSGNGAAGVLRIKGKGSADNYIWADASSAPGQLRISTLPPEEDGTPSDTSGTVIGTQTSSLDTKDILGDGVPPDVALSTILETTVRRFTYKGGTYSGTEFHGIIADYSPEFAMDPDEAHPHGRSFNPVSAFGYTVQAIKALQQQIDDLRTEVARLSGHGET